MFGRSRTPKLSRQQVEKAIAAVEQIGQPRTVRRRGKQLGEATRKFDRACGR
jgi:hypothetical protein